MWTIQEKTKKIQDNLIIQMWTIQKKTKKIQDNLIQMWTIHIFPVTPKIKKKYGNTLTWQEKHTSTMGIHKFKRLPLPVSPW